MRILSVETVPVYNVTFTDEEAQLLLFSVDLTGLNDIVGTLADQSLGGPERVIRATLGDLIQLRDRLTAVNGFREVNQELVETLTAIRDKAYDPDALPPEKKVKGPVSNETLATMEGGMMVELRGGTRLFVDAKGYTRLVDALSSAYVWDDQRWVGDSALVSVTAIDS